MRRIARWSAWLLVLFTALPGVALGQAVRAGVATVVEGDVTTRRESLSKPVALRFRDDVFRRDTIVTAERSLARLLLGGKATVTVRERSRLTVTEVPGTSLVDLGVGKVGVAVARERMQPGDVVEIRTPNAIVAVRGTVVIAELVPVPAAQGLTSNAPAWQSNVYVLTGKIEARELRGGVPVGPVYPVGRRQMITISPLGPPRVTSFPESRLAEITEGLQPSKVGLKGAQAAAKDAALRAAASDLAEATVGDGERQAADWATPRAPIEPQLRTATEPRGGSVNPPAASTGLAAPTTPGLLAPAAPAPGAASPAPSKPPATATLAPPTLQSRVPTAVTPTGTPTDLRAVDPGKTAVVNKPTSTAPR